MKLNNYPPEKLPFPKLFIDYLSQNGKAPEYFEYNPFDESDFERRTADFKFMGNREKTVTLLTDFNSAFHPSDATTKNIQRLSNKNTYTIVTGQQLTLLGGPLFTIYKVLTAIHYCQKLNKISSSFYIPVFWLADEDHDFEEISGIGLPAKEGTTHFKWTPENVSDRIVADILLDKSFEQIKSEIQNYLLETDFSDNLWSLVNDCYKKDVSVGEAFGQLLRKLFGHHGLVLAGSNHPAIKSHLKKQLTQSVEQRGQIFQALSKKSDQLEDSGYHRQVVIHESNLFMSDHTGVRRKLSFDNNTWSLDTKDSRDWSDDQLISEIEKNPENFSPNVILRPILQDVLLPTMAYVGGPGEVSYYAQMKEMYPIFNLTIPVIIPRFSCTLIETGIENALEQLPFNLDDYLKRIEDLESEYVKQSDTPDIESIISEWKKRVEELTDQMKPKVSEIDPTLENSAGKASATYLTELDKLKGKLYRSAKQQESTQLNRIVKIKNALYPNGNLQEREIAFIYFMNKYGLTVWDDLLEMLSDYEPSSHIMVHL